MFKLIIADDEIRIREGFLRIVDWESLGFRVVGCYADGSQVLDHLRREHADVVLTDIKMKQIGGLEVAQCIREKYPNTVCVLVSAYQEFEFAHAAIASGVKDYLFKPTRLADIRRVFSSIAQDLEQESELLEQQAIRHQKYEEMNQLLRSQFHYDLYMGALRKSETVDAQARHYYPHFHRHGMLLCFMSITREDPQEETSDILRRLFQISEDGLEYDPVSIKSTALAVMAIVDAEEKGNEERFRIRMEEIIAQARETSGICLQISELRHYDSLQDFINRPRLKPGHSEMLAEVNDDFSQLFLSQQRLLLSYLTSRNLDQAYELVHEMVARLERFSPEVKHSILVDTAARIQTKLQEMDLSVQTMPRYDLLMKTNTPDEMKAWMQNTIKHWVGSIPVTHTPRQVVSQIKAYILENYAGNVSLDTVAEHVFLSSVYVSRLFKQETGENYTDFITRVRIDKACELLKRPDILVADVGQRVGYPNPRYFYRVFKNITGDTPSTYRSRYAGEDGNNDGRQASSVEE